MAFDPEGFHHFPDELKTLIGVKTKSEIIGSFEKTLQPYVESPGRTETKEAIAHLAEITLALPQILEMSIQLINWKSLANAAKKNLIAFVAYIVSPVDIIPEGAFGTGGFVDDALFASIVFNTVISATSEKFVAAFWKGERRVFDSLCVASGLAQAGLPNLHREVTLAFKNVFA